MVDVSVIHLWTGFAFVKLAPVATPRFVPRVEEDAAVGAPIEVVNEHLLQIGIAGFAITNEFPFGVNDYFFS